MSLFRQTNLSALSTYQTSTVQNNENSGDDDFTFVYPITEDLPKYLCKKSLYGESFSVVEIETESSDEDGEFDLPNHNVDQRDGFSRQESSKARKDSIDSQSKVSSSGSLHGSSKCVMCGKEFQHTANLRVHLQSHLGARAQLKSCEKCDRSFSSRMLHQFHQNSHIHPKLMGLQVNETKLRVKVTSKIRNKLVRKSLCILRSLNKHRNLLGKLVNRVLEIENQLNSKTLTDDSCMKVVIDTNKDDCDKSTVSSLNSPANNDDLKQIATGNSTCTPRSKIKLKLKVDPLKYRFSGNLTKSPQHPKINERHESEENLTLFSSMPCQEARLGLNDQLQKTFVHPFRYRVTKHRKAAFPCMFCSKKFAYKSNVIRHARIQHELDMRTKTMQESLKNQMISMATLRNPNIENKPSINLIQQKQKKTLGKILHSSLRLNHIGFQNNLLQKTFKSGNKVTGGFIGHQYKFTANKTKSLLQTSKQSSKKDSHYLNSREENNSSKSSLMNIKNSAFSPQYTFDSPSASPSTNTNPKSTKRCTVQDLTCPTCDKTFPAKSIFERHIKTYKHGRYEDFPS